MKSSTCLGIVIGMFCALALVVAGGVATFLFLKPVPQNQASNEDSSSVAQVPNRAEANQQNQPNNAGNDSGKQKVKKRTTLAPPKVKPLDPSKIEKDPKMGIDLVKDELLVTLHPGKSKTDLARILKLLEPNAKMVGEIPAINMFQIQLSADAKHRVRQKLENHPFVATATFNMISYAARNFDDPTLINSETLDDWGIQKINSAKAWDKATGKGTTIAIVDSGTLTTHEEMSGKLVDPYSFANPSGQMVYFEFIDANSGRIDRLAGHGTHVAITAAGTGNNKKGTVGIAPDAKVMPIQVMRFIPDGSQANGPRGFVSGSYAEIIAGITRAISAEVDVINLSLGRGWSKDDVNEYLNASPEKKKQLERDKFIPARNQDLKAYGPVIDLANKMNVILVNAAGNDDLPARLGAFNYSNRMISVAAIDKDEKRASFSNHGKRTDVSAPGVEIFSGFSSGNDAYTYMPGTSMACPHVAGLVALMREKDPDITFSQARKILIETGKKLNTDKPIGPLVNAYAAIEKTIAAKDQDKDGDEETKPVPPVTPQPTPEPKPEPPVESPAPTPPTPEEIVNGPAPWTNPEVQRLIDLWLSIATPPLEPVDGRPWFYDKWGRHLNNYNVWANYEPDHGSMTRHQWVWQFAKKLESTRHGTLYEFVLGMLRDGKFDPAPNEIPKKPKPAPGKNKKPAPGNSNDNSGKRPPNENGKPSPSPADQTNSLTLVQLTGPWSGANELGNKIDLVIFQDQKAWLTRNGQTLPYTARLDHSKSPSALILSQQQKDRVVVALEQISADELKSCTYFSTGRPRFRDGDKKYTYRLKRNDKDPGDANLMRHGFTSAKLALRSTETMVVGSEEPRQFAGTSLTMKTGYQIVSKDLSRDGSRAWIVIDNVYPDKGAEREKQVWSVPTSGGAANRISMKFPGHGKAVIKSSHDGNHAWILVDYSKPAAVQAIREFKIYRATSTGTSTLVADTGKEEKIAKLGLAQDYQPNVAPDGSLWFSDWKTIWRVAGNGFEKMADRDTAKQVGMDYPWNASFGKLQLSGNGQYWIALLPMKRGDKGVNAVLRGSASGKIQLVGEGKNLNHLSISNDGHLISYHDYEKGATLVGKPGNLKPLKKVGNWATFGTRFVGSGERFYAVVGSLHTSNQAVGFLENTNGGQRYITHSDNLIGPQPTGMTVSGDGSRMIGKRTHKGLALINLKHVSGEGPKIKEALYRADEGRLTLRLKVDKPDEVQSIKVVTLHEQYIPMKHVYSFSKSPFPVWQGYSSMRPNRFEKSYFEAVGYCKKDFSSEMKKATYFVTVHSKDRKHVSNYIVKFE